MSQTQPAELAALPTLPKSSLAIAAFSTIVEWYDFTLYLYMAPMLARVFFGASENNLSLTLAGFALAYLMRPLGAMVFGYCGDRWGRRQTMLWSMTVMALAMLATGLLPSIDQVGAVAGLLLVLLRCVMAFSVGGEYNGVIAYLLEGVAPERRGLMVSLAVASSEVGALLAVAVAALTTSLLDAGQVQAWGWRIPFIVGAVLAGGIYFARSTMAESPLFEHLQRTAQTHPNPLLRTLRQERRGIVRAFAISALGSITYYVGITYVPAFLSEVSAIGDKASLYVSTVAALAVVLVTPLVGWGVDRFGRRPTLIVMAAGSVLLPGFAFLLLASDSIAWIFAAAIVLAVLAGGVSAVGAVASAEQFAGQSRLSGLAIGNTGATVVFGGLAPLVAQLMVRTTGWPAVPGVMIALTGALVLPVFIRMAETRPRRE